MNFRDKLARLSAPRSRASSSLALDDDDGDGARSDPVLAQRRIVRDDEADPEAGELARADLVGQPDASDASFGVRTGREVETDEARAERIARLRGLIGDVLARGAAWRAPQGWSPHARETRGPRARDLAVSGASAAHGAEYTAAEAAGSCGTGSRSSADMSLVSRTREMLTAVIAGAERASARSRIGSPVADLEAAPRVPGARLHMLRAAIDGWAPARARLPRVFARQPWATRETPHGPVHIVERWLEPSHSHGNAAVHSALERLPATLAAVALDPALAGLDLSHMLFLDTETTGLAGGSGTVAFLVGLAQFHDDALLLTQLLLPNLGGEVPMLLALAEHLAAASCVLTYNGKSFDWPLLRTRYVMNRLPVPALPPHVDLLHASRRVWKPRLGSVRLTDVEREILRFLREGDVDGAEIPSRYFSFLHDGGSEWLVPVLEHNQNDLIALPALLGALGESFERIECGEHALDALAYGRLALRAADSPRAAAFARAAVAASEGSALESHAWSFRGEVARRGREAGTAAQHFEHALALCVEPARRAVLHVTLAKLYEHALRDLQRAYRHARCTELSEGVELHGRRLGRLTRKLERRTD